MLKNVLWRIACLCTLLLCNSQTFATHIMGGNLSYQYLGLDSTSGNYRYKLRLELFRLCDPGSSLLPVDMNIGVYEDDTLNPTGDKIQIFSGTIDLIIQQAITPPNGSDTCTFAPSVCVEEGIYEGIVSVPPNNTGYYFISDRCCRNSNIANIDNPGNTGQAYYAAAPPPTVVNNSPTFAVAPVPFVCNTDTASVLNQAFDADGDLLVYSFVTPYAGISDGGNPNPNPPGTYPWQIPNITYAPTYSVTAPFGPGGYASINNSTGLSQYYSPNQGFYVVAVEIEEFRNGILVGISRRDIQIIVIACPANPAPNLAPGSTQITYTIDEGDTLCFSPSFFDPNGDSLFITHTGDVFDSLVTTPTATFVDASGAGVATGQFCWATSCDQGSSVPYQFSLIATDKGCPAKTTNIVYTINVIPTPKALAVNGPDTLCGNANGILYTTPLQPGYTHLWTVVNGTIVGSNTGDSVIVNFTGPGTATVAVETVNSNNCHTHLTGLQVVLNTIPTANAGSNVGFCSGSSATIGVASTPGYTYLWSPSIGLSGTTVSSPTVTLTNSGAIPITSSYIVTVNNNGCTATDTVQVTINPSPTANAGLNVAVCSDATVTIGSNPTAGYTYSWSPATGLSSTSVSNPTLTLTNSGTTPLTQTYTVLVQNTYTCTATDNVDVTVNPIPAANAGADSTLCSGTSVTIGSTSVSGVTYSWSPSTGLSSATISNPVLTLTNTTGSPLTYNYIVTSSLAGCSNTDTVAITINPSPAANAGSNQLLCSGTSVQIGTTSTPGYTYLWTPALGLNNTTISNPTVTLTNTGGSPISFIYIVTVSLNGCTSSDTVQVTSSPAAAANAGADTVYCSGAVVQIGSASQANYTYSWTPASGLSSSTISNPTITTINTGTSPITTTYTLTSNLFGCTATDNVTVTVNPSPISSAGTNQFLCAGGTVQLGGATTSGYIYSWTPSGGLSSDTISNPVLTLNNTSSTPDTILYVVSTTFGSCTTTDTVQVISSPVPTANAGSDTVYCSGASATLGSGTQANYVYNWSPGTGLSSTTISDPLATLTNTGTTPVTTTYILSTNLFGCLDADTVLVTVKPNPLSEAGTDATICGVDTLQIGTATTAGYLYNWTPSLGLSNTNISNPVVVIPNSTGSPATYTYFVSTELNGCFTSDSIIITVNPQPVISASANPTSICAGDSTSLTASGASSYSWALSTAPGTVINTNASFTVSPSGTTTYIVTGTNGFNCSNTNTVTVTVNALPTVQITSINDTICNGDSLTLTGNGASTYTWSVGGNVIGTGTFIVVSPASNTTYVCTGTSSALCVDEDSISIYVNPTPVVGAIFGNGSVCPGVTGVQYYVNNPNANSSYTWVVTNGTIASGQGTDTVTIDWSTIPGIGVVSVVETNSFGCESNPVSYNVSINVLLTPVAPTGPTTLCANTSQGITYTTLGTPGSSYNWFAQGGNIVSGNGTNSVNVDWAVTGPATVLLWYQETSITSVDTCFGLSDTLSITINPIPVTGSITGPTGICVTDSGSFSVNNTSGSTYNWTVNGGTLISGNGTNTINAGNWTTSGTAVISVIETNSIGCTGNTVNYNLTVNALPNVNAGTDASVCIGQGVYLNATGGNFYVWSPTTGLSDPNIHDPFASPTTATTYIVLVTDSNGCKNTDSVLVSVNSLPNIIVTNNSAICTGSNIQLSASGGNSYQWSPNGTLSNDTIYNPVANPTLTTTYTVVVTDGNTCVDSAFVTITVNPLPIPFVNADTLICAGTNAQLFASGGVSYLWTPSATLNNANAQSPIASPTVPTTYVVTVTDANGCSNDTSTTVNININPQASFTVNNGDLSDVTCDGYDGTLTNTSVDAFTYLWIFPNGTTSTDLNPQVQFNLSGNNTITLIATNNVCNDTAVVDFASTIIGDIFSQIPNIFTPNGDNLNDCFDLGSEVDLTDCSHWEVYNRWGKKVFENSSAHPCWNGKKDGSGADLSDGTYYIVVEIADKKYHGSITLVR